MDHGTGHYTWSYRAKGKYKYFPPDDLLLLWNGIPIVNSTQKIVKAALLGVSSDMPALRKVLQYLGHKADLG